MASTSVTPRSLPSVLPNLFMANWKSTVTLETSYLTSISTPDTIAEQRISLIKRPYRRMDVNISGLSKSESYELLGYCLRTVNEKIPFPLFSDFANVSSISSDTIFCDPTYRRFFPGARFLVYEFNGGRRPGTFEYGVISSVQSDRIVASTTLSNSYTANKVRVFPVIDGDHSFIQNHAAISDEVIDVTLSVPEFWGANSLPVTKFGTPDDLPVHDGYPVLDARYDWGSGIRISINRHGNRFGSGKGFHAHLKGTKPYFTFSIPYISLSRKEAWKLIQLFDSVKGRSNLFWFPNPQQTWEIDALQTTHVDVFSYRVGLSTEVVLFSHVYFDTGEIAKIDSVTSVGGDKHRLTFESVISDTSAMKATSAHLCRFSNDSFLENWITDTVMETSLDFEEVINEKDVTYVDP